jgi:hypothetical protein
VTLKIQRFLRGTWPALVTIVVLTILLGAGGTALAQGGWNDVSASDSVITFGIVSTGLIDSAVITVTNNLAVPVSITSADFEEDVFSDAVVNQGVPIPA